VMAGTLVTSARLRIPRNGSACTLIRRHEGDALKARGVVEPRVVCQEPHVAGQLAPEVQARRELDSVARPQRMAS